MHAARVGQSQMKRIGEEAADETSLPVRHSKNARRFSETAKKELCTILDRKRSPKMRHTHHGRYVSNYVGMQLCTGFYADKYVVFYVIFRTRDKNTVSRHPSVPVYVSG